MKQCPKCNYACADEDVICKNCGFLFSAENNNVNPQPQPGFNNQPQQGFNAQPQQGFNSQPQGFNAQPQNNFGGNQAYTEPKTNGMATASLVVGIISVVTSCCFIGGIGGIVSLILGILAKNKIKSSGGAEKGDGFALAGIILSIVAILFTIYMIISIAAAGPEFWTQFNDGFQQGLHRYK
ncbi:MAG TPA: DUF4190 domain-containing protein [Ruminiclostridium sp.]|nr:DUF4190 domain-containing protein [Ruminiclostridium sp.]